ncbi:hypothetical protein AVEN_242098-1 [Araneus ventricosus]|uniref:Uncharacterized protein n=1 Tax=Araneus ventricosus TaxID=182803 RepID=A0A4Y2SM09_ARAVE|nr:hypothetical protein AVEN_242098-1 [Araneus ventricosus]
MGIEITYYCLNRCRDGGKLHGVVRECDVVWLVPVAYHRWRTVYVGCNVKQVAINAYGSESSVLLLCVNDISSDFHKLLIVLADENDRTEWIRSSDSCVP